MEEKYNGITNSGQKRNFEIIKTSIIGIVANVLLAAFKALVGFFSNSIAIILDAVNNISDAGSSLITIIGTKLANKKPDRKHPFGHGRIEYLSAMLIAFLVLYAGLTSFIESIQKIINPVIPEYSTISLIIVAVAIIVKIVLGIYVKNKGEKLNSASLVNSGDDAKLDSVISASTLIAALIFLKYNLSLEAYLGAIISAIIIKSGIGMLKESISSILGERVDIDIVKELRETICSFEGVQGMYDLMINNYGPNSFIASVHIEIPDTFTADKIDKLTRDISYKVYEKHNIVLSGIGIYSVNTKDKEYIEMKSSIVKVLNEYKNVLQMHGFYLDKVEKTIRFDVVISFDEENREKLYNEIYEKISNLYKDYKISIALDTDFSVS